MKTNDKDKIIARLRRKDAELRDNIARLFRENAELRVTNEELRNQVQELQRKLNINSRNSSMPPSSDPPGAKLPPKKHRRPKKRGARKGHTANFKKPVPPELVTQKFELEPDTCPHCGGSHFIQSQHAPIVNQYIDLPPIKPEVIEYVRPVRTCSHCGKHVHAKLPSDAPKHTFGPGVQSMIAILTGILHVSKRKSMNFLNHCCGIPISLGGLSNCEQTISKALQTPVSEIAKQIQTQPVAHADETSWKRGNREKGWMWTLCSSAAAEFRIFAGRGRAAAESLLDGFSGVLVTDRWSAYRIHGGDRQICWAHLLRDLQAISESGGQVGFAGEEMLQSAKQILWDRRRVREKSLRWETFQRRARKRIPDFELNLEFAASLDEPLSGKCRNILKHREWLWTFVDREDVQPTNNAAERAIRKAVIWRKTSFGTQSERGARYAERVLSVLETCRLQAKNAIEFIRSACTAHYQNLPAPSLFS